MQVADVTTYLQVDGFPQVPAFATLSCPGSAVAAFYSQGYCAGEELPLPVLRNPFGPQALVVTT